jgi:hypothetical protein
MVPKRILVPDRLRRPPATGWSWVDRRFVRDHMAYLSRDARLRLRTPRLRRHEGVFIRFDNFEPGEAREIEGRNVRVVEGVTIERVTPNGS